MAEEEWGLAIMTTSLSLCSRDEDFARGLTRRAEFVRLVNDCTLPDHAFSLSCVCVKLGGFGDLDRSGHVGRCQDNAPSKLERVSKKAKIYSHALYSCTRV